MLQRALDSQAIRGVYFPTTGLELLHNMFADDLSAIIRALLKYILEFQQILNSFGEALDLHFAWEQTIASCIPAGPPPPLLRMLPWKWEGNEVALPLLGIPFAASVAMQRL